MPTIKSPVVRLSYPFLFKPKPPKNGKGDPKYSCMLIVEPGEDEQKFREAIVAAAEEQFGNKGLDMLKAKKLKNPLRPGSDMPDNPTVQGKFYINVSSRDPIDIVDRHLAAVTDPKRVYAGMYVRAVLAFKYYNVESQGIGAYINGLQLVREGERIDGRASAKAAFDDGADLGPEDDADQGGSSGAKAPAKEEAPW